MWSVATYILDSGLLVDLALQVLENALSEKRVCRHDVWFILWFVLFGCFQSCSICG